MTGTADMTELRRQHSLQRKQLSAQQRAEARPYTGNQQDVPDEMHRRHQSELGELLARHRRETDALESVVSGTPFKGPLGDDPRFRVLAGKHALEVAEWNRNGRVGPNPRERHDAELAAKRSELNGGKKFAPIFTTSKPTTPDAAHSAMRFRGRPFAPVEKMFDCGFCGSKRGQRCVVKGTTNLADLPHRARRGSN